MNGANSNKKNKIRVGGTKHSEKNVADSMNVLLILFSHLNVNSCNRIIICLENISKRYHEYFLAY